MDTNLRTNALQIFIDTTAVSTLGNSQSRIPARRQRRIQLQDGTGNNQANQVLPVAGEVTAGMPIEFDLRAMLLSIFGISGFIEFSAIKQIIIFNNSNDGDGNPVAGQDIILRPTVVEGWTTYFEKKLVVGPGGTTPSNNPLAGYLVTPLNKKFTVDVAAGTDVAFEIVLVGVGMIVESPSSSSSSP